MTAEAKSVVVLACPKCAAKLVNIVSGAICPKGCGGGLFPRVPAEQQAVAVRDVRVEALPKAVLLVTVRARDGKGAYEGSWCDRRLWLLPGCGSRVYRRVRRTTGSVAKPVLKDGTVIAYSPALKKVVGLAEYKPFHAEVSAVAQAPRKESDDAEGDTTG